MNRLYAAAVAAFALSVAAPAAAQAQAADKVACEVVEIEAQTTDKPAIDPALGDLSKSLTRGPFARYNTFKQSARIARSMTIAKADTFSTPNGKANLTIRAVDRPAKKKARISLGVSLEGKDGKQYIDAKQKVDAGKFAMFAYEVDAQRGIITAISCK